MTAKGKRCMICGRPAEHIHHLIGGTANRRLSERFGLVEPLCADCHRLVHEDPVWNRALKRYGQRKWEEKYGGRDEFIKIFGKSWEDIDDDSDAIELPYNLR